MNERRSCPKWCRQRKRIAGEMDERKSRKKCEGRAIREVPTRERLPTWHAKSERIWTVSVNYQEIALTWLSSAAKTENSLRIRTAPLLRENFSEEKKGSAL